MEEVDPIRDRVLDEHALGVVLNEAGRGALELVGQEEGGLLVTQLCDGDLAQGTAVVR